MNVIFVAAILCCTFIGLQGVQETCRESMNMNVKDANRASLKGAVDAVIITSDLREGNRDTDLQKIPELNTLNAAQLQDTARYNLYEMIAICKVSAFQCRLCDLHFIAMQTAMGDPECYFTCSYDESMENVDNLPTEKTFETYVNVGLDMNKKGVDDRHKKERIMTGMRLTGKHVQGNKRVVVLPLAFLAAKAIFNFVSMIAINFAANAAIDSGRDRGTGTYTKIVAPMAKVKAATGCFMADSSVNVKLPNLKVISKSLRSVEVGDLVESWDAETNEVVFTTVYYMAHAKGHQVGSLLRVFYRDESKGISSLSLSGRHLVYATKENNSLEKAPLHDPIQAKYLNIGDNLWVLNEAKKLEPHSVVQILPFQSEVRHPLTENHHIIVDGVHASVHVLHEELYRLMTSPLRLLYHISPELSKSSFVDTLVKCVETIKEPMFNEGLMRSISGFSVANTITF